MKTTTTQANETHECDGCHECDEDFGLFSGLNDEQWEIAEENGDLD